MIDQFRFEDKQKDFNIKKCKKIRTHNKKWERERKKIKEIQFEFKEIEQEELKQRLEDKATRHHINKTTISKVLPSIPTESSIEAIRLSTHNTNSKNISTILSTVESVKLSNEENRLRLQLNIENKSTFNYIYYSR